VKRKIILAVTAMIIATGGAVVPSVGAMAKITSVDTSCTNNGGNQPGGQQPSCTGGGLTQDTENQNPAGQAPPGQNP
jgi:hypothetical protein